VKKSKKYKVWKTVSGTYQKYTDPFEILSLKLLEEKHPCTCGKGPHFPRIISQTDNLIEITGCGETINNLQIKVQYIPDYEIQLNCIFNSLYGAIIVYTDIYPWNICVDDDYRISLIVFESITFKDRPNYTYIFSNAHIYYLFVTSMIGGYIYNNTMLRLSYNPYKYDEYRLHFIKCMLCII